MSASQSDRMKLVRILSIIAMGLLFLTYVGGGFSEYRDPVTDEIEEDDENLSFQPLKMFMPDDVDSIATPSEIAPYIGERMYLYFPTGFWAYVIAYKTAPIWRVSLEAPQYPKASYPEGIPVYFNMTHFTGKVVEMNVINHYIGMDPMDVGAFCFRQLVPIVYLIFFVSIIGFMFYSGPLWWLLGMIPACFAWFYIGTYSYYLYWFGHNLHEYGAFTLKPFMPTVLGDGKVAQFVTHSYPSWGFYILLMIFVCLTLATLIKRRVLRESS